MISCCEVIMLYEVIVHDAVQRSDIAMAITKHDMFDFLIDIVPREEIQFRTKKVSYCAALFSP